MKTLINETRFVVLFAFALVLALGACGGNALDVGADSGPRLDAKPDKGEVVPRDYTFEADDDGKAEQAVALKLVAAEGKEVEIAVVVRGVESLQGAAFRLMLAPDVTLVSAAAVGDFIGPNSVSRLQQVGRELWAGVAQRGLRGVDARSERAVATIKLRVESDQPHALTFKPHHNMVVDGVRAERVEVSWLGGTLKPHL